MNFSGDILGDLAQSDFSNVAIILERCILKNHVNKLRADYLISIIGGTIIFDNFLIVNNFYEWVLFYIEKGKISIIQSIFQKNSFEALSMGYAILETNTFDFIINQTYFDSNAFFYGFTFYQILKMNFLLKDTFFEENIISFFIYFNVLGRASYFEIENSVFIDIYNEGELLTFQTGKEDNNNMLGHSKINKVIFFSPIPIIGQEIKSTQLSLEGKLINILNEVYFLNLRSYYNIGCLRVLNDKSLEGQYTLINNTAFLNIYGDDYYIYDKYMGASALYIQVYQDIYIQNCLFKNNVIKTKNPSFKGAPCIYSDMFQGTLFINGTLFENNEAQGTLASCIIFFGNALIVDKSNFIGNSFIRTENDSKSYGVIFFTNGENCTIKDCTFFENRGFMISIFSIISKNVICFMNFDGLKILNNTSEELQIYISVHAYSLQANNSNFLHNKNGPKGCLIKFTNEGKRNFSNILFKNCFMLFNSGDGVSLVEFNIYWTNFSFQSSVFSSNKGLCFLFLSDLNSFFSFDNCIFTLNIAPKIVIFHCLLGNIYIKNSILQNNYVNLGILIYF